MLFTTTRLQSSTYLLGVCLFSIAFLVFLNASVSFVITDLIGGPADHVGDDVGTLGFADELLALVACPVWGLVSDRVGVRVVAGLGYAIIALALVLFVQARNVYPQLLLARLAFSIGGAAVTTMVTAALPAMTQSSPAPPSGDQQPARSHGQTPSLASELTITPDRHQQHTLRRSEGGGNKPSTSSSSSAQASFDAGASSSRVAGIVGTFTGLGALLAVGVFLPLPTRFARTGASAGQAVADSYYVVAAIAAVVAGGCLVGLRGLRGDGTHGSEKGERGGRIEIREWVKGYGGLLREASVLGWKDTNVGLAYLGGAVARASSVGISLFIPLYIHNYFIVSGRCQGHTDPGAGPGNVKKQCHEAYILSSQLTGVSQLAALLIAPLVGHLSALRSSSRFNIPLLIGSLFGILSYLSFTLLPTLHNNTTNHTNPVIFVIAIFIGLSQITAIVCSLGLLGRGIHHKPPPAVLDPTQDDDLPVAEETPLLAGDGIDDAPPDTSSPPPKDSHHQHDRVKSRIHLKGSAAGLYSLSGGAGILVLTKLGGWMFDEVGSGAPFWILAGFNAILLVAGLAAGIIRRPTKEDEAADDTDDQR